MFEKFMNLREIKSHLYPMVEEEGAGGGTGVDSDADTGEAVVTDSVATETPPEDTGAAADEPFQIEVDGEVLTEQDIRDALDSHKNKSEWTAKNIKENEELNILKRVLDRQTTEARTPVVNPPEATMPDVTGQQLQELLLERPDEAMSVISNLINSTVEGALGDYGSRMEAKNSFLSKHQDFNEVTASPEFINYMSERPYFNDVNGYLEFKLEKALEGKEGAEKAGFTRGEKDTINNLKAKGGIRVLTGSGSSPGHTSQQSLKDMSPAERASAAIQAIQKMREAKGG